jgi:hypothetical protein
LGKQKNILLSGNDGKTVYYIVNGEGRTRSMAEEVERSDATIVSANDFGKAVRLSAALRAGLAPLLPVLKGRAMINRVNNICNKWIHHPSLGPLVPQGEQPYLYQFQFNDKTTLAERLRVPLQMNWSEAGVAVLAIPAIDPLRHISAPNGTSLVHCKVGITSCFIANGWKIGSHSLSLDIPYKDVPFPAQQLRLPYTGGPGSLTIVAMALTYALPPDKRLYEERLQAWMPAGIVATRVEA